MLKKIKLICIIGIFVALLMGCSKQTPSKYTTDKIKILTTFGPIYSFSLNIVDDSFQVENLINPGTDIHTFFPTIQDIKKISDADIIIINGAHLEEFLEDAIKSSGNTNLKIIDTSNGINLQNYLSSNEIIFDETLEEQEEHEHNGSDPHTWLSIDNAKIQVKNIQDGLIKLYPNKNLALTQNTNKYLTKLNNLKEQINSKITNKELKPFIVLHNAYGYFLNEFGLQKYQVGVLQEFPDKEITQAQFKTIIDNIQKLNVSTIFSQPQFSPKIVNTLQSEYKLQVLEIDPIGKDLNKESYEQNMINLSEKFIQSSNN